MQDFGEYLAEIRDRLHVPLPPRVRRWRLFVGVMIETFCYGILRLVKHDYRSIVEQGQGMGLWDIDVVLEAFGVLKDVPASRDQVEQAKRVFEEQVMRRHERISIENAIWLQAMRAGTFIGLLIIMLLAASTFMAALNDHPRMVIDFAVIMVLTQILATLVCLNDWHRP